MTSFQADHFILHALSAAKVELRFCSSVTGDDSFKGSAFKDSEFKRASYTTRFGNMLAVVRGDLLFHIGFQGIDVGREDKVLGKLVQEAVTDEAAVTQVLERVLAELVHCKPITLAAQGTAFQQSVWRSLLTVPAGARGTYRDVANAIGRPSATRAVGSAIGANPWAVLIPCHRICRADGGLGGYRWGLALKRELLAFESATTSSCTDDVVAS